MRKIVLISLIIFSQCKSNGSTQKVTTDSGIKYLFHVQNEDKRAAQIGDLITLQINVKNDNDEELAKRVVTHTVSEKKGTYEELLPLLHLEDSLSVWINVDSLMKIMQMPKRPPTLEKTENLCYVLKVKEITTQEELEKQSEEQKKIDDEKISSFLEKNKIDAIKTESGLYYYMEKEGTGATPVKGDTVSVYYTLKNMKGDVIESNQDDSPFDFVLGVRGVIAGWDEAFALLKKDSEATLLIPSHLAYGKRGQGEIEPNSILIFDVKLVDIKQ